MSANSDAPLPSPTRRNLLWWTLQKIVQVSFTLLFRYQARGLENVPNEGPAMFLVNHQSYLDPLLLGMPLRRPVSMVARKDLFRIPVLGWTLRGMYGMEIDRDAPSAGVVREMVRRLDHGFLVAIFPEGTRTSGTELGPIKPGFVSILRRAKVPVIPVGIAGADRAWPRGTIFIRPTRVRVHFGTPITAEELAPLQARGQEDALIDRIRDAIRDCVNRADKELQN